MAFAAARMIKEKKNLEAEHKKRSSDGLSKTKSKVILPHVLTHQNHIRHPQCHITSYLDTSWHTTTAKWFFSYHVMTTSMVSYHVNAMVPYQWKYHLTKDTGVGFAITSFIWLQMTHETVLRLQIQYSRYPQPDKLIVISEFNICRACFFFIFTAFFLTDHLDTFQ